jgi:hypothetical protein
MLQLMGASSRNLPWQIGIVAYSSKLLSLNLHNVLTTLDLALAKDVMGTPHSMVSFHNLGCR